MGRGKVVDRTKDLRNAKKSDPVTMSINCSQAGFERQCMRPLQLVSESDSTNPPNS